MNDERFEELLEEQKRANRYLRSARRMLGTETSDTYTERAYWNARHRMRNFQKKHNQHLGYQFSMKGLDEEDLDTYEEMLKSVTENTRLNPSLARQHKESQISFYQKQGWAKNEKAAEAMYNFKGTSIFEELMDNNLTDVPSELLERYGKFIDSNYTEEDFSNMLTVFNKELMYNSKQYKDSKDFFKFTDKYIKLMKKGKDDFQKGVKEYIDDDTGDYTFFDYMEEFYE